MKKLLPQFNHVTKAGSYGNEDPAFFALKKAKTPKTPYFAGPYKSWHDTCYMYPYKNNKNHSSTQ